MRSIARRIGRAPSSVSREIARNDGRQHYRAVAADARALRRLRRPKVAKLARCHELRHVVEEKLELRWSPQQIAKWLPGNYPDDLEMRVSHETIYMSLFVQGRGALRKELHQALRTGRAIRRPKAALSVPVAALPRLASAIIFASSRSASRVPAPGLGFLSGAWIVFARWIGEPFALRPTYTRRRQTPGATSCLVPFMLAIVVD